ncbi:MAG: paraquat-inducible protein A [Candidatus Thiodiazotropha sp. (ex Lucinoma kastoroae)]|nr:paraquat-inducible protein A [Candidatus Thiodiazotropha sp. (ex Lucinoma kastoroae)]MCU7858613.1 paraquat-inducible protein A [Candidatus Thiodiazotropha sp. (ex Lucinoma kastoroae)]
MIERNEAERLEIPEFTARWLRWLLLLTSCLLMAGLYMPMVTLTKFLFIANSFSVLSGVQELFNREQWFLFLVVGLFSVILPVFKIVLLFLLLHYREIRSAQFGHLLKMMHDYGRWAMLDVMVVAVMIVTVKLGVIAEIEIHTGLYLFGAAVLLIMYITHQVVRYTQIP